MKRSVKGLFIPISLWENEQLTLLEKAILIELDSYLQDSNGLGISAKTLAGNIKVKVKDVKESLNSLAKKGAIDVGVDEDGVTTFKAYLYKDDYSEDRNVVAVSEHEKTAESYDYDEIQAKWSEINPGLPPIQRFTPQRKRKLRSVLKSCDATLSDLYKVFQIIASNSFLNGNSDKFKATFDWVVSSPNNFTKIIEGFYSRSYSEKQEYTQIMNGVTAQSQVSDIYK